MHFFFFIGVVEFMRILLVLMGQKSSNGAKRCTITTNSSVSMHEVLRYVSKLSIIFKKFYHAKGKTDLQFYSLREKHITKFNIILICKR